jgi:signal peptidase II
MASPCAAGRCWFWTLVVIGFALDQASKFGIFAWLQLGEHVTVIPNFLHITHNRLNHGAVFGLGGEFGPAASLGFAALSVVAIAFILYWSRREEVARDRWLLVALALVVAGAAGNFVDRVLYQGVRDFIWLHHEFTWIRPAWRPRPFNFAVFNIADICLVVAALMLVIHTFFLQSSRPAKPAEAEAVAPTH